jgi:acetylornithine deacetylase/succinyl-diaminopimelate desuccinylase-like protein
VTVLATEKVMQDLIAYIDSHVDEFVEDLRTLCRQPSISAQNKGIDECVDTLGRLMRDVGVDVKVVPVKDGNPVVLGEVEAEGAQETLGFYNHYDVQPPDPLELWETPPFEAAVKDGRIYARGVSDNKGNIMSRLGALRAVKEVLGETPVNLRFLIEGEEEIGSRHLPSFVKENKELLRADGYIWEGDGVDGKDRPVITLGAKGILYVELRAKGAKADVHSSRAPLVPNPAWRLVWALASMKGSDEKIRIPGWYDDVVPPTDEELQLLKDAPFDEEADKAELGLKEYLGGVSGVDSRRALYFSTTCTICGFDSGYKGPRSKTVLPSEAMVKVGFRLVEAQRPDVLFGRLVEHLERNGFGDIEIIKYGGYEAAKTSPNDPFVRRVVDLAENVYGSKPVVWPTTAGTSPIYLIRNWMKTPVASGGGVGYPGSNIHAPNENIRIRDYVRSIKYVAALICSYGHGAE